MQPFNPIYICKRYDSLNGANIFFSISNVKSLAEIATDMIL